MPDLSSRPAVIVCRLLAASFAAAAACIVALPIAAQSCAEAAPPEAASEQPLADELPRIPPVEPEKALETFTVQHGFRLELVAHEPAVSDPVDACFDEDGRLYVAEMHGYPFSHEPREQQPQGGGKKNAGIIRLLEDADGDGVYDKSTAFADGFSWPQSVCCYRGGVFVLAPPDILYFKDTDGDGRADVRETVYSGFGRHNVQSLANGMKWGLDNHIWLAGGRNPTEVVHRGKKLFTLGSRDLRFDPKTENIEAVSGGQQFGHSFDDWGNRFVCSNSNHIMHVAVPAKYLERAPRVAVSNIMRSIAKEGPAAPVFRKSVAEPWRIIRTRRRASDPNYAKRLPPTELVATGFFTSATGVTIYRGGAYPPEFHGNAFIGDVGGNLVHRKSLTPHGATFQATRADAGVEFITSTDNWFRPVNFVNAPDGTLYILDMYRETIEHPVSIPEDIKAHLDLESGDDRGRIYRIAPPDWKQSAPPKLGPMSSAELVAQLESPNSWSHETAQRLLWERQDRSVARALEQLVHTSSSPLARLHALHTLDGLKSLSTEILSVALFDDHPLVREHAVELSEGLAADSPGLVKALLERAGDTSYRVRLQLAYSLGELPNPAATKGLAEMVPALAGDADLRTAWLTSAAGREAALAVTLMSNAKLRETMVGGALVGELARLTAAAGNVEGARAILAAATTAESPLPLKQTVVRSVAAALKARGDSLDQVLNAGDEATKSKVRALFEAAAASVGDDERPSAERLASAALLAHADFATARKALSPLLEPAVERPLQAAAIAALAEHDDAGVGPLLLENWRSYSPQVRRDAIDALLARAERIDLLFEAVDAGRVGAGEIERETKQLLENYPNGKVRARARKLFAGEISPDRAEVVARYSQALEGGDAERGRAIYDKRCAQCHKVGESGHEVGPNLVSTKNKSPDDLLLAILDPNREAQPNFTAYTVVTTEGKLLNGIIAAETPGSLTLRRAEGKEDVVLRENIEELASTGKSLMPEGLEKDITAEQMADVIAFVRTLTVPEKTGR
ncbi:MAG: c-type cytochrome [Planctomycetes bacterium]|nr:c-type cytochrome [Planctomycetota bacterium]